LVESTQLEQVQSLCFRLLGTLGMRVSTCSRVRRPRRIESQTTILGDLPFKVRDDEHGGAQKPEFDALCARASELGLTPREAAELLALDNKL